MRAPLVLSASKRRPVNEKSDSSKDHWSWPSEPAWSLQDTEPRSVSAGSAKSGEAFENK